MRAITNIDNGSWTGAVTCAVGDTDVTIMDSKIKSTSTIDVYSESVSGDTISIKNIVITNGSAVLTFFEPLTEQIKFKLHIIA